MKNFGLLMILTGIFMLVFSVLLPNDGPDTPSKRSAAQVCK